MKKLMIIVLVCGLLFTLTQASMAAIHPQNSEFTNWSSVEEYFLKFYTLENDKWFDITKMQPSLNGGINLLKGGQFFQSDSQTIDINYTQNELYLADGWQKTLEYTP